MKKLILLILIALCLTACGTFYRQAEHAGVEFDADTDGHFDDDYKVYARNVTATAHGDIEGVTVQDQLEELETEKIGAAGVPAAETDPSALKTAGTDNVKDTHIDWGSGAGQVNASDMPATAGGTIEGVTVQAQLDEIASEAYKPGGTDVAVTDGGTGASTALGARNNLGPFDQGMGTNWIVDPDFRLQVAGANHWYTVVNAAHDTPLYGAYGEGTKKGVKFTHDGNTYCIAWTSKIYPAKDNDVFYTNFRYFLSSDYEDSDDAGVIFQIQAVDAAGEATGGVWNIKSGVSTRNAWATKTGTMTITDDDTQYINVSLYVYDSGDAGVGYAQVDYVFLGLKDGGGLVAGTDYLSPTAISNTYEPIIPTITEADAEDPTDTTKSAITGQRLAQGAYQLLEDNFGYRVPLGEAPASGVQWFGMFAYFEGFTAGGADGDPAGEHANDWDGPYIGYLGEPGTPGTWISWLRLSATGVVIPNVAIGAPTPTISDPDTWTTTGYGKWIANAAGTEVLPAVAAGMNMVVSVRGAYVAVLDPNGTDEIFLNGTSCGAGVSIQSEGNDDGEQVALQYSAAGDWDAIAKGWICTP